MDQENINSVIKNKSNLFRNVKLAILSLLIFSSGWLVGGEKIKLNSTDIDNVSSLDSSGNLSTEGLQELYEELVSNYDGDIKNEDLVNGIKDGLVASVGDTYTEYLSAEETADFNSDLNGTFEGIGAELGKQDNFIVIIAPIKGTPADKAGIQPQDIITEINGESTADISVTDAVKKIRGEKGTEVKLKLIRDGEQVEVSIIRETIDIASVESKIENGIGIIQISRFSSDTTELVEKAAKEFNEAGVAKVVLDMRGNPGGLLDQAVGVASVWLDKGATVLEEKRGGETVETFTTNSAPLLKGIKTVVMIDEGSASASEIVAGALKDNGAATLLGQKSYGKGSVQQLISLNGGGSLKVTIARWYTPGGKNIDKEGIEPDVKAEITAEDIKADRDPQLDVAIQFLNK
ncbi:MAG: S41 family peptidase [Candidatus Saccharibacteria bacterium]|nr:S41 family peptidase [Candidatus Saccharibacteria bacterium]